jgi:hypothetical protein
VGYAVPNDAELTAPVPLDFSGVTLADATRARLILAADYPWFEWNGVNYPPTHFVLRVSVNGAAFHERGVTEAESNAFADYFPELGGAGASAGLLNQAIDLDLSELHEGDNRIEPQGSDGRTARAATGPARSGVGNLDGELPGHGDGRRSRARPSTRTNTLAQYLHWGWAVRPGWHSLPSGTRHSGALPKPWTACRNLRCKRCHRPPRVMHMATPVRRSNWRRPRTRLNHGDNSLS